MKRWGHGSVVERDRVYIYGGRMNSSDLNSLLELDLNTMNCQEVKQEVSLPKGRRKAGLCVKNSLLFVHSGFNGDYTEDFFTISLIRKPS